MTAPHIVVSPQDLALLLRWMSTYSCYTSSPYTPSDLADAAEFPWQWTDELHLAKEDAWHDDPCRETLARRRCAAQTIQRRALAHAWVLLTAGAPPVEILASLTGAIAVARAAAKTETLGETS